MQTMHSNVHFTKEKKTTPCNIAITVRLIAQPYQNVY